MSNMTILLFLSVYKETDMMCKRRIANAIYELYFFFRIIYTTFQDFLAGLITGGLVTKFGTKICGCCGAMLSATGIAVCFIAPNLEFLIIFVGVMSGLINLFIECYFYTHDCLFLSSILFFHTQLKHS